MNPVDHQGDEIQTGEILAQQLGQRCLGGVPARSEKLKGQVENVDPILENVAGDHIFNTSPLDFRRLLDDPVQIAGNMEAYIAGFSSGAREVIDKFDFEVQINRLDKVNLLYLVIAKFAEVDLHPDAVSDIEMGYLYEELVRRFCELSNETAGEHLTPSEVIRLMVNLLFAEDDEILTDQGAIKTLFDPACGTGGMLSVAGQDLNLPPSGYETYFDRLTCYGQWTGVVQIYPLTWADALRTVFWQG